MAFQYANVNSGGMSTHYHARSLKKINGNGGRLGKYETMLFCIFRAKDKTKKTGVKGYGMQI